MPWRTSPPEPGKVPWSRDGVDELADAGVLPSVLSGRRGPHEGMTVGRLRRVLALLAVTGLLATLTPTAVLAEGDTTPPVPEAGTPGMAVSSYDKWSQVVDLALTFVDHESGVASVLISCDGGSEISYPYAGHVAFVVTDPSVGGCSLHGGRTLQVRAVNGDGAISDGYRAILELEPMFKLEYPLPAVTGQPFTVRIHYSAGYEPTPHRRMQVGGPLGQHRLVARQRLRRDVRRDAVRGSREQGLLRRVDLHAAMGPDPAVRVLGGDAGARCPIESVAG